MHAYAVATAVFSDFPGRPAPVNLAERSAPSGPGYKLRNGTLVLRFRMASPCSSGASRQRRLRWREVTLLTALAAGLARGQSLPPGFVTDILATNLNAATALAPAPDGRIFIAEQ